MDRRRFLGLMGTTALQLSGCRKGKDVIIALHGGGWCGDLSKETEEIMELVKSESGVDFVILKYTLGTPEKPLLDNIDREIRGAIKSLSIGYNKPILYGESAGGHLATLFGFTHPNEVKAVISNSGIYDLERFAKEERNLGMLSCLTKPKRFKEASPIEYVSGKIPKTLIIHTAKDEYVPVEQADELVRRIRGCGNNCDYLRYSSGWHILAGETMIEDVAKWIREEK